MSEDRKLLAIDPMGNKIYMPDTGEVDRFPERVNALLMLIAPYLSDMDATEWAKEVLVTDLSSIGDFGLDDEGLKTISGKLGFSIKDEDLISDVALRMGKPQ